MLIADLFTEENINQQMALYKPNGSTYRQQSMPGFDTDDLMSKGKQTSMSNVSDINDIDMTDAVQKKQLSAHAEEQLAKLPGKERVVLRYRLYYDYTLEQVGELLGVNRERVRQIEARALRRLRVYSKGFEQFR